MRANQLLDLAARRKVIETQDPHLAAAAFNLDHPIGTTGMLLCRDGIERECCVTRAAYVIPGFFAGIAVAHFNVQQGWTQLYMFTPEDQL